MSSMKSPPNYGTNAAEAAAATSTHPLHPTRRPWQELFSPYSFSCPNSYADATRRVRLNLLHFRVNYAMAALFIVFLSLLWRPISMIVFLVALIAWAGFYFYRAPGPVVIFNRSFGDGAVLFALGLVTVVALVLTGVGVNVLVALVVVVVVVGLHAAFRVTEDLYFDEESGAGEEGGLVSVVGSG